MRYLTILILGLLVFGPVWAKTPDGKTPAEEGVCDALKDHTPGLYGLCVAYCEAQDLESAPALVLGNPNAVDPMRKITANASILAAYERKRGAGDPDMPCLQVPCPCWSLEEIAPANWNNDVDRGLCVNEYSSGTSILTNIQEHVNFQWHVAAVLYVISDGRTACIYDDAPNNIHRSSLVSPEEFDLCKAEIRETCEQVPYPTFP